jgi:endonuclease YncB( thermonuclease family)
MAVALASGLYCGQEVSIHRAELIRVIDGDSAVIRIHLGAGVYIQENSRLLGIDTPEGREGKEATEFTTKWLEKGPFKVGLAGRGKYGRPLIVPMRGLKDLPGELEHAGLAVKYCP